ncbi:MAG: hypothetical protein KDH15_03870 [Rhodocyclaceae bacterium]|nr:hypothetical protein [Rhodocyclaceae bacterium]
MSYLRKGLKLDFPAILCSNGREYSVRVVNESFDRYTIVAEEPTPWLHGHVLLAGARGKVAKDRVKPAN